MNIPAVFVITLGDILGIIGFVFFAAIAAFIVFKEHKK